MQILDICLLFGAPNILQSDNGAEFTASIISQLKDLWPECKIVHGKPRHPQSQGSVERANADIKDMTVTWMHIFVHSYLFNDLSTRTRNENNIL